MVVFESSQMYTKSELFSKNVSFSDPMTESVANSQEYGGEKGRFMPPRRGPQASHPAYAQAYPLEYNRSLSSQL
jgi:hypothetical protein